MYEELIEKLNPKPKFNLRWYHDEDLYSEGEIEDVLIQMIAENEPEDYVDAIHEKFNWSTFYHLTCLRKNILNWYPFKKESSVLEIGCGIGAITGVLCDKCQDVTAVELSKKRATGALLRCREKDNLEIIVGNLNDIEFTKKYDYITLVGVLEYQGSFTNTADPYSDFLKKIKTLLKPEGKLLIAIENQFGLKYWCGAVEDHTGIPFEGMNRYRISGEGIRTFSKADLDELVKRSGFKNTYFYYPMPDYKLPTVIYSQDYLPQNESMNKMHCYYVPDNQSLIANERNLYKDVIKNGVFEFFANSFLVECSDAEDIGDVTFATICSERKESYRIATRIMRKNTVEKIGLNKACEEKHLKQVLKNERMLEERGLQVWKSRWENNHLVTEFSDAPSAEDVALEACKNGDLEKFYALFDQLYEQILRSSDEIPWEENIIYGLELGIEPDKEKFGPILRVGYLDMILKNAFYREGEMLWFDQEWILEAVPARFVLYRAINELYYVFPNVKEFCTIEQLVKRYEMISTYEIYQSLEWMFSELVFDETQIIQSSVFRGSDDQACERNIEKILQSRQKTREDA